MSYNPLCGRNLPLLTNKYIDYTKQYNYYLINDTKSINQASIKIQLIKKKLNTNFFNLNQFFLFLQKKRYLYPQEGFLQWFLADAAGRHDKGDKR